VHRKLPLFDKSVSSYHSKPQQMRRTQFTVRPQTSKNTGLVSVLKKVARTDTVDLRQEAISVMQNDFISTRVRESTIAVQTKEAGLSSNNVTGVATMARTTPKTAHEQLHPPEKIERQSYE